MKLVKRLITISSFVLAISFPMSVSASETVIVEKGKGYTVTSVNDPSKEYFKQKVTPLNLYTCGTAERDSAGGCGSFDEMAYGDGILKVTNSLHYDYAFNDWSDDSIILDGSMTANWSGYSPSANADQIVMKPRQIVDSTTTAWGVGLPAGVSGSQQGDTYTMDWNPVTLTNRYNGSYTWDPVTVKTSGVFEEVKSDAQVTWVFGGNAFGQLQQLTLETE